MLIGELITARESFKRMDGFPVKMYIFKSAVDVYSDRRLMRLDLLKHLNTIVTNQYEYAVAGVWSYREENPAKVFNIVTCWPEGQVASTFLDGDLEPLDVPLIRKSITAMKNISDVEYEFRKMNSLEDYLKSWPSIDEIALTR